CHLTSSILLLASISATVFAAVIFLFLDFLAHQMHLSLSESKTDSVRFSLYHNSIKISALWAIGGWGGWMRYHNWVEESKKHTNNSDSTLERD
ncbi:hypothetical protein PENTCL1PPCAC_19337, partial [Pristionchus entomophagus]